ncbi:MAG: zinc ribbon domain-containing protein [Thermoanaerobaculia bacterium]
MNVLETLWNLQKLLSEVADLDRRLSVKPDHFAEIDRRYETAKGEMDRLQSALDQLGRERRKLDSDLQVEQEALTKFEGQMKMVKNQQQYSAAWKEIDIARKKKKEIEDAELAKMAEIESAQGELDALKESHAELTAEWEQAHGEWQESLHEVRSELEKVRERVADAEAGIPPGPLRQFQRIFEQRHGLAMSLLEGDACGACRFKVRSQAILQVHRGDIITCEGCRRIVYAEKMS